MPDTITSSDVRLQVAPAHPRPSLHDFQRSALNAALSAIKAGQTLFYISLPAGTGKAVIAAALAAGLRGTGRVLLVAHRIELIRQLAAQVARWCGARNVGIVMGAEDKPDARIIVGSVQSLVGARLDRVLTVCDEPIAAVIIDECHHAAAGNSYAMLLRRIKKHSSETVVIGFTATPRRDARGFYKCVFERQIADMIEGGWLAPLNWRRIRAPIDLVDMKSGAKAGAERDYMPASLEVEAMRGEVISAIVNGTIDEIGDRTALAFSCSVEHAQALAAAYDSAGLPAAAVWGAQPPEEREHVLRAWRAGEIRLVTNFNVLTEGFDFPEISALVMARPTRSRIAYLQMLGRGMRLAPGKTDCLVLDAMPLRPDERQVTLEQIVPLPGLGPGVATLALLDPRSKWPWGWLPEHGAYIATAAADTTLWLVADPSGSGLYRIGSFRRTNSDGVKRTWPVADGDDRPVPLADALLIGGDWLRNNADLALAAGSADWREDLPSPRQLVFIKRHTAHRLGEMANLDRGQASAIITETVAGWNAAAVRQALWSGTRGRIAV